MFKIKHMAGTTSSLLLFLRDESHQGKIESIDTIYGLSQVIIISTEQPDRQVILDIVTNHNFAVGDIVEVQSEDGFVRAANTTQVPA